MLFAERRTERGKNRSMVWTVVLTVNTKSWTVGTDFQSNEREKEMLDLYQWLVTLERVKIPNWFASFPLQRVRLIQGLADPGNFCWWNDSESACNKLTAEYIGAGCEFFPTHSNDLGQTTYGICVCGGG